MIKPLVIRPDAEKEATEARLWYEERSMKAARNFVIDVRHAFEVIQKHPERSPRFGIDATRYRLLRRYPFIVVYRELGECTEILAVAHTSRRPGYWRNRTKSEFQ